MKKPSTQMPSLTVGLDLGDRFSYACILDTSTGETLREVRLRTTRQDLLRVFPSSTQTGRIPACTEPGHRLNRVRMEAWLRARDTTAKK